MTEPETPEQYHCSECDATNEWNDDCLQCKVKKHIEANKDAYIKMGKLP